MQVSQSWKLPHIVKGALTWIPPVNAWRRHRASTGGTDSARYCYSVWLRHLVTLQSCGFQIKGARVAELGPGDSIGSGLAALLSGADYYIGLDVVPFSAKTNIQRIFDDLVALYIKKTPIPDDKEFPYIRPKLKSYKFPNHVIDWAGFRGKIGQLHAEIQHGLGQCQMIGYQAPWTSVDMVIPKSLDLIFSQSVLQYSAPVEDTYNAMSVWLRPGSYASHEINFGAHYLSPFWNGHWAYSDWQWKLTRGRREFFLNRAPLSSHLAYSTKFGFEILRLEKEVKSNGLPISSFAPKYRKLNTEDLETFRAHLVLRKISDEKHS